MDYGLYIGGQWVMNSGSPLELTNQYSRDTIICLTINRIGRTI